MSETTIASTLDMNRENWLQLRKLGVGGSDASAVAGFNRYRSPLEVWAEKVGEFDPPEAGEAAYWGTALEDLVAKEFSRRTNMKVRRSNKMYQHPKYPFMLGNVDRLIHTPEGTGILECKTASAYKAKEWDDNEELEEYKIPEEYEIQLQHYLEVLDLDFGYFAVLIGGNQFKTIPVKRNRNVGKMLIEIESDFWNNHVKTLTPPPVDGSKASTNLMNLMYPDSAENASIELTAAMNEEVESLRVAKANLNAMKETVALHENHLKAYMGNHESAMFGGDTRVTWKSQQRTLIDSTRLKSEAPDLYKEYSKQTSSRRFLLK